MARRLERFCEQRKGNGLRSTSVIKPGELLYRAEPFACIVSKKGRGAVCEGCFFRKENLLRCSQCKIARYCNASCQKQAWTEHKKECKCLKSCQPNVPTDSVRLIGRIIFKLMNNSSCPSEELYFFSEHKSHIEDLTTEMKEGLVQLTIMLQHYLKEEMQEVFKLSLCANLLELFAKLTCNCFTISDGEMQEIGAGLYPSMSLLNHDCDPNCLIVFEGKHLFLRAIREIQPSEELTVSYIDVLTTAQERQMQLKNQYCFLCECRRCKTKDKDEDMLAGDEQAWKTVKESIPKVEELQSQKNWEEVLAVCQTVIDNNQDVLPDRNIYLLKMLDCALDACINLACWDKALHYGIRTLQPYGLYYTGFHPLRAIQLMFVGKIQYHQEMFKEAFETLKEAFQIMKVTHGQEHHLIRDLQQLIEECQIEVNRS
ncbi:histone-lysine N-methyltransferase SMYD3 isoform X1 [Polypterus senegalus]|uniref:histone-lysine N-methyltransferase SMYD3 isoform X1 n=2 Tax=Polypterus senegalus TaxID=55291 RepID=UPI001966700B|nr:histone-lysine N-methyltransferase SMYD3 isoform X1 [Polypterus senegalus]